MIHYLELPYGMRLPHVKWDSKRRAHIYEGSILPDYCVPYASKDYSLQRWKEDDENGVVQPVHQSQHNYVLHPHQKEDGENILKAYLNGERGFLIASETGVGKTLSAVAGVCFMAQEEKRLRHRRRKAHVLIVTTLSSVPHWRETLRSYEPSRNLLRPLVINYGQIHKLLKEPKLPKTKRKRSTHSLNRALASKGVPLHNWDYIIFDESHTMKNYGKSNVSLMGANIAQLEKTHERMRAPFVVYCTATPGATPLNFSLMSGIIAPLITKTVKARKITPSQWGSFLHECGFDVSRTKNGWVWAQTPWYGKNSDNQEERERYEQLEAQTQRKKRQDTIRIGKALSLEGAPFVRRKPQDIAGWDEQTFASFPIELSPNERNVYEEAWTRFRRFLNLDPKGRDPKTALVENLRYRQKSSLLKVPMVAEFIKEHVDAGRQVYVSCEFTETVRELQETLEKKKVHSVTITGADTEGREEKRLMFQKGSVPVVITTVVESISFQANEKLPDGTMGTSNQRVSVICDVRANPESAKQSLGRAHRNGENSVTYFPYLHDTVDETIIRRFLSKMENMSHMVSDWDMTKEMETIIQRS